jgi:ammonia channel protein AmtB
MLIGFVVGILTTYLNSKKRSLNEEGVIDSLGSLFVFFIPSVIGAIYSAILFATSPYGPTNLDSFVQKDTSRDRWGQGGFQLIGMCITIGIAIAAGVLIGLLMKTVAPR